MYIEESFKHSSYLVMSQVYGFQSVMFYKNRVNFKNATRMFI